jgi:hypothetical protein
VDRKLIFLGFKNRDQQILGLIPLSEISYSPQTANPQISMINPQSANTAQLCLRTALKVIIEKIINFVQI